MHIYNNVILLCFYRHCNKNNVIYFTHNIQYTMNKNCLRYTYMLINIYFRFTTVSANTNMQLLEYLIFLYWIINHQYVHYDKCPRKIILCARQWPNKSSTEKPFEILTATMTFKIVNSSRRVLFILIIFVSLRFYYKWE